jgi:phage terminase large subunit
VGLNSSNIIFKGLKKETASSIKSIEGVDVCWIEEAQYISRKSLDILIPTIRKEKSKIILSLNPTNDDDPIYTDYVIANREDNEKVLMNYNDNPFFPEVLKQEMEYDKEHDFDKYLHIWEGQTVKHSDAQVFKDKWSIDKIEKTKNVQCYYGADFGYSPDPNTLIECFIQDNILYITKEAYKVKCEIADTPILYDTIITKQDYVNADCSRPELISYLKNLGYNIVGKNKLKVEDGVTFLRSFKKIIIDEGCKNTIYEFRNYCYNVDRITGQITNKLIDKHNHCIDALRYAIYHLIKHCQINKTSYSANSLGL